MASASGGFVPDHADFFELIGELFADSDSEDEDNFTFEGFNQEESENDLQAQNVPEVEPLEWDWEDGDRNGEEFSLPFTGNPGISEHVDDVESPIDYFELFVDDDNFEDVAVETNRYAHQYLSSHQALPAHSRYRKWTSTSAAEIKRFFALIIAMGLLSQSDITEYWTVDPVTSTPFFPSVMSRDRFLLLMSFFHLSDNSEQILRGQDGHNPLYKLGNIYRRILSRFATVFYPNKELSIDEGMVPWRGNLRFRVYSPDKPVKYGLKAYMLCDSTNGYCLKFHLYTGKKADGPSPYGATYDEVMSLLTGYFGKGHEVYCDNYYSSPTLFLDLWRLGVGATGTVRKNRRGLPQTLLDTVLEERNDTHVMHKGPMCALKYLDHKAVYLLSTTHTCEPCPSGHQDPRTHENITRPAAIVRYNKMMGGVDRADQMVVNGRINTKTLKWWKKLFFHMLSLLTMNAYIVYKSNCGRRVPMLQRIFRRKLVQQLVSAAGQAPLPCSVGRPSGKVFERLKGRHFPKKIVGEGKKLNVTRKCVVCTPAERQMLKARGEQRKRPGRESSYCCGQCDVALCVVPCFELYHTKQEYVLAYKRLKAAESHEG